MINLKVCVWVGNKLVPKYVDLLEPTDVVDVIKCECPYTPIYWYDRA